MMFDHQEVSCCELFPPHLIVAASTALLPRGADAAVYLNGSANITFDQSHGVRATAVNANTSVSVSCTTRYLSGTGARYLHS